MKYYEVNFTIRVVPELLQDARDVLSAMAGEAGLETFEETADGVKILTFKVSNTAQQKWIKDNRLRSLEGNLQKKLGTSKLRLEVGVVPMEEKEVQPYTDQEKATALMGQNGEVQNLIKDFGLETK